MKNKISISLVLLMLLNGYNSYAQLPDLPILHDTLYAVSLKEKRPLEIVLPAGYDPKSAEKYDVLYVTDGEWNTRIVSNIQQFLGIQFTPPNIIVSIPNVYVDKNNMRGRDLTPTHIGDSPLSGGADNYLSFIKNDLIPYIEKKYHTSGDNTLFGGSLGGLFSMYVFCKEPQLFQSYLLADPSFWWDHDYSRKLLKESLEKIKPLHKTLLITGREGGPYQEMGIAGMDSLLHSAAFDNIHWKTMVYNDETHNSMIFRTVYDGLKFTYAGYAKEDIVFHPMAGILLKDKPVTMHCNSDLLKNLHYTTDGSTPTTASPKITADTFDLVNASHVQIKSFSNRENYDKTASGSFTLATSLAASARPKTVQPGGWHYTYYEGTWDSLPNFKDLKPVTTGLAGKDFDITKLPKKKNFACVQEGQLEIKTDGYYIFGIDSDGGSKLFLGNRLLINYDGLHSSGKFQSFVLPLVKGFYPFRLEYFQKEGNPSLQLIYLTPGTNQPSPIPLELEYAAAKK